MPNLGSWTLATPTGEGRTAQGKNQWVWFYRWICKTKMLFWVCSMDSHPLQTMHGCAGTHVNSQGVMLCCWWAEHVGVQEKSFSFCLCCWRESRLAFQDQLTRHLFQTELLTFPWAPGL